MNLQKTGTFLKQLRKEKELTQEQLAQKLNVSTRTVSRWETGHNMPDLDVLVELADLYNTDIREIIDGERNSETVEAEQKETLMKIADYAKSNENALLRKITAIISSGIAAWVISFVCMLCFIPSVKNAGIILIFEAIAALLYSGVMYGIKTNHSTHGYLNAVIGAETAAIIGNLALFALFFGKGSYHNYGILGVYYALYIIISSFLIAGIGICLINQKAEKRA